MGHRSVWIMVMLGTIGCGNLSDVIQSVEDEVRRAKGRSGSSKESTLTTEPESKRGESCIPENEDQACISLYMPEVAGRSFRSLDGSSRYLNFIDGGTVEFPGPQGDLIRSCYVQNGPCIYVRGWMTGGTYPSQDSRSSGFLPEGSWLSLADESTLIDPATNRRYSSQVVYCE